VPEVHRRLAVIEGDAAAPATLAEIRRALDAFPVWRQWTRELQPAGWSPLWIGPGLELARNTEAARRFFTGFAASLFPDSIVPPFAIGGAAVTEVTPQGGTAASHSRNDLPAPPHTAGFFEPVPPLAILFACVRPHPGGGAETTVIDLPRLLEAADPYHVTTWMKGPFHYRTSTRLGGTVHPLRILRTVSGQPFLRYRKVYTLADGEEAEALEALDQLVRDPRHVLPFSLSADEILVVWNGTPHGRSPQIGPTPADPDHRRLLLRCRVQPRSGWATAFKDG
jgi:hypothetical protein